MRKLRRISPLILTNDELDIKARKDGLTVLSACFKYHPVSDKSKPSDANLYHITVLEAATGVPSNTLWGSSHDYSPAAQSPAPRSERNELSARPDHLGSVRRLPDLSINRSLQLQSLRVRHELR